MSDLVYPISMLPRDIASLFISDSWLVSGPLGQALCKLASFSIEVSTVVSSQSLVLIAVDRFGTVVFPLRSPLISLNKCRFFILATWIIAMVVRCPILFFFEVLEYPDGLECTPLWSPYFKHYKDEINNIKKSYADWFFSHKLNCYYGYSSQVTYLFFFWCYLSHLWFKSDFIFSHNSLLIEKNLSFYRRSLKYLT